MASSVSSGAFIESTAGNVFVTAAGREPAFRVNAGGSV